MKRNYKLTLMLLLLVVACSAPGCGAINKLRAKNSLNEGVREFNKGKFDAAEEKFDTARHLSPDLANANLFYARTVYQQYDQKRNDETAAKAITAYKDIIENNPGDPKLVDMAYAFLADVYDKLYKAALEKGAAGKAEAQKYKDLQQEALLKRAELPEATTQTKAAVYYTIGQGYWAEAYNLSRYAINFDATLKEPIPPERANQMQPKIDKALEYLNKALEFDPEYADAWSYKKLTLLQQSYITNDPAKKTALQTQIKEAEDKTKALFEKRKKETEAEPSSSSS